MRVFEMTMVKVSISALFLLTLSGCALESEDPPAPAANGSSVVTTPPAKVEQTELNGKPQPDPWMGPPKGSNNLNAGPNDKPQPDPWSPSREALPGH